MRSLGYLDKNCHWDLFILAHIVMCDLLLLGRLSIQFDNLVSPSHDIMSDETWTHSLSAIPYVSKKKSLVTFLYILFYLNQCAINCDALPRTH